MHRFEQVEAILRDSGGTMLVKNYVTPAAPVRRRYGQLQATVPPQVPMSRLLVVSIEWTRGVKNGSCKLQGGGELTGRINDAGASFGLTWLLIHFSECRTAVHQHL